MSSQGERMSYSWLDEVLPDAVVVADEAQRITGFNPAAERLWGCAAAEVLGQPLATLIPTRLQRVHHEHVTRFGGGAEPVRRMDRRVEVFGRRRDGNEFPCEVSIARRTTERGVDFVAVVRDLSDHRRAQRIAQLGDWSWDLVTGEQRWSPEARRILFGAGPEGVFNDCVHPDDRLFVGSTLQRALGGNAPWDLEHRVVHRDGTVRQVHQLAEVTRDAAERPLRLVGTVQDVTEVRRVQRSLLESEATVRALFEGARDAVVLLDPGHVVRSANVAAQDAARALGAPLTLGAPVPSRLLSTLRPLLERASAGESVLEEVRIDARPPRWLELSINPLRLGGDEVGGLFVMARDLTQRRTAEEQLRQAQKLDVVGRLAGGVAHDFNNLLTAIIAATSFMREELPAGSPLLLDLADIDEASARASALTRQLLSFARRQPADPRVIDVAEVVPNLERMLRRVLGSHINLQVSLEPCCYVEIDPTQFEQVLMNLVVNARDAMPSGGTLRIDGSRTPGGRVRLTVSDTGAGFSEEVGRQLFEPFFTTKGPALGTGLGLATCHGIITEAGGTIVARSTPGQGAVFEVELPSPVAPLLRRAGRSPVPVLGGTERVLLVDDDARVRALLSRALQRAGYEVQVAASGTEALTCFARAPCQLVIADVVMPDLGGYALLARLREQAPTLPVLLMTGYAAEPPPRDVAQLGQVEVLAKPFSVPELLQRARALLEAESTQEPEQVGA